MTFENAQSVQECVQQMRLACYPAAQNRALTNALYNGAQPLTEQELKANRGFMNVNWLEGSRIVLHAGIQLHNAFLKPGQLFQIKLDGGPPEKRDEWGAILTQEANRLIRRNPLMNEVWKSCNAQTVLHGIGPCYWPDTECVIPTEIGIDDVMVPARTLVSMRNLEFFALYREWTYPELYNMAKGDTADPGWNMKCVNALLEGLKKQSMMPAFMGNRWLMPEKLESDLKENSGWFASNVAPAIFAWDFYFCKDVDHWERRIILDAYQAQPPADAAAGLTEFLYDSSRRKDGKIAESWREIVHFQFGNVSPVYPAKFHSVRSLGFLMYAPAQCQNMLRNRTMDAIFESLLTLFKNVGEGDRERIEKTDLSQFGVVQDGLSFVTAQERNVINENLVALGLQQNQKMMADSSAAWTSSSDSGGGKTPATATEEIIKMNNASALLSAMLNQAYEQAEFLYREQCRRLCIKGTRDKIAKKFQERVEFRGVPKEALDVSIWDVQANRVLGGGNQAMEVMQADRLMAIRPQLDPQSQRKVDRIYVLANSNDADLANDLVAMGELPLNQSQLMAQLAFSSLMQSIPFEPMEGINLPDYIETLLKLMQVVAQQIQGLGEQSSPELHERVAGMVVTSAHVEERIQIIAQNPAEIQRAKAYEQALQQILDSIKPQAQAMAQQDQEKAQEQQIDPVTQAKVQSIQMLAETKAQTTSQIKMANENQKLQHKDAAFMANEERKNAATAGEIQRGNARAAGEIQNSAVKTRADLLAQAAKARLETKIGNETNKT